MYVMVIETGATAANQEVSYSSTEFFGGGARSVYHTVLPPPGNLSLHLAIQIPLNLEPHSCILCLWTILLPLQRDRFLLSIIDRSLLPSHKQLVAFAIAPHDSATMARARFIIVIINHSMLGYIFRRTLQKEITESIHDDGFLYMWESDDCITPFQSVVTYCMAALYIICCPISSITSVRDRVAKKRERERRGFKTSPVRQRAVNRNN
jgi:hypothetical protein